MQNIHDVYVAFDNTQIKSVNNRGTFDESNPNIYYQPISKTATEYDYIHNQVTGERIDIEMNNDIKVDKIKPQKISAKLPFKISKKPAENKKALFEVLGLNTNNILQENKNTNEKVTINKTTVEKSISNKSVNNVEYNDFCAILYNTKNLFANAQKILSHKDAKKKTNITINRYANVTNINGNKYLLEFIVKNKGELELYSVDTINNRKELSPNVSTEVSTPDNSIYSINDIQRIFKSKLVNKYNNDYLNLQKNNGIPILFQENNQTDDVNANIENARGFTYQKKNFDGTETENLIVLLKKVDKSTLMHEFAHVYLITLNRLALHNAKAKELLKEVNKWLHYDGSGNIITTEHELNY